MIEISKSLIRYPKKMNFVFDNRCCCRRCRRRWIPTTEMSLGSTDRNVIVVVIGISTRERKRDPNFIHWICVGEQPRVRTDPIMWGVVHVRGAGSELRWPVRNLGPGRRLFPELRRIVRARLATERDIVRARLVAARVGFTKFRHGIIDLSNGRCALVHTLLL